MSSDLKIILEEDENFKGQVGVVESTSFVQRTSNISGPISFHSGMDVNSGDLPTDLSEEPDQLPPRRHTCFSNEDFEDLFEKNTESFRCLAQILISRSSLLRHILYHFPPLEDPGIEEAFNYVEPEPVYDDIGCEKYKTLCKESNIVPITRVLNSLPKDELNLKYYGLTFNQTKAICSTLMLNAHVKHLILEDNWITPEGAYWIGEMLRENNSIQVLNLKECRLGAEGAKNLIEGLSLNQSVKELDLSYNDLEDKGLDILIGGLKENQIIEKLNLKNNKLGEHGAKVLGEYLAENASLDFLDISWNQFNTFAGMKELCKGLTENQSIKVLNLAWNGISTKEAMIPLLKFIKATEMLEHLNLSNNRLDSLCLRMVRAGIMNNSSLISINLGFNLITPDDAIFLVNTLFNKQLKLQYMDLENTFVEKRFVPIWKRITDLGKNVRIEGILNNYSIIGPNKMRVYFERCRYLGIKPKKRKQKKDFGHFIYTLPDELVDKKDFQKMVKKFKIKLDTALIYGIAEQFTRKSGKVDLKTMKATYLDMYPETQPPPPKPKKKKKKKPKKGSRSRSRSRSHSGKPVVTEEKATITSTKPSVEEDPDASRRPTEEPPPTTTETRIKFSIAETKHPPEEQKSSVS